jgi:hypothetical protein
LTRIVRDLQRVGEEVQEDALACISPYLTEHINRFGDFSNIRLETDRWLQRPESSTSTAATAS